MNFPAGGSWYLVPHDELVDLVGQTTNWLNTTSWQKHGGYSSASPSPALLDELRPFALDPTLDPADDTATESNETPPPIRKNEDARPVTPLGRDSGSVRWRHSNLGYAAEALAGAGYTCTSPPPGLEETDIIARRQDDDSTIRVRCPGRLHISKQRIGKDIHIVFPDQDGIWYLGPHDELVDIIGRSTPWLDSYSWLVAGWYSSVAPSRRLRDAIRPFALDPTLDPADDTATESNETPPPIRKNEDARPVTPLGRDSGSGRWRHPNLGYAAEALAGAGYTCTSPPPGLEETDIIARRQDDDSTIRVRCPGRLHISKQRIGKDIHIVFPDQDGIWYLGPHDELVDIIGRSTPWVGLILLAGGGLVQFSRPITPVARRDPAFRPQDGGGPSGGTELVAVPSGQDGRRTPGSDWSREDEKEPLAGRSRSPVAISHPSFPLTLAHKSSGWSIRPRGSMNRRSCSRKRHQSRLSDDRIQAVASRAVPSS